MKEVDEFKQNSKIALNFIKNISNKKQISYVYSSLKKYFIYRYGITSYKGSTSLSITSFTTIKLLNKYPCIHGTAPFRPFTCGSELVSYTLHFFQKLFFNITQNPSIQPNPPASENYFSRIIYNFYPPNESISLLTT